MGICGADIGMVALSGGDWARENEVTRTDIGQKRATKARPRKMAQRLSA
jgi:hypothetical protein